MTNIKAVRALKEYKGFRGSQTMWAILNQIPDNLKEQLTSKQIGEMMTIIDNSYQQGRADERKELEENGLVTYEH